MALSLNSSVQGNATASTVSATLPTITANDIVIADIVSNGGPITNVTASGLTFSRHAQINISGSNFEERWSAVASSSASNVSITTTQTSSAFITATYYSVSGGNTFDSGGPVTASTDPISITTHNANTMVIAFWRLGGATGTAGSGFTAIQNGNFQLAEYQIETSTGTFSAGTTGNTGVDGIVDAIVATAAAGLPPGQQSFATPQPDRNTNSFPQNLRHWAAPDRLILIGQDSFPPGAQSYQRPLDPQDPFAQWRSYVDSFPLELIGQDALPPGKRAYDLPASQVPDPFARWRSWTYSYNLNLIGQDALPPGRQSYQRSIDPADAFAQWRSWTWQYRPILIGQDAFPPGTQLYSRQVDPQDSFSQWRSWTNFNINLFPPPAVAILPPGAQLYSRFIDPSDGFAQWRSFAWFSRNLAGQDVFPPGRQINFLPLGATWRPESPQPNLIPALTFVPPAPPPGAQLYALWSPLFDSFAQWRSWANFNINLFPPPPVVPPPPGQQLYALPPYGPPPLVPPINYVNPVIYGIPTPPPSVIPIPATYYLLEDLWVNNTYLPAGTVQKTADLGGVLPINWVPNPNVDPVDPNAIAAYAAAGYRPRGLIRTQFSSLPVNAPNYNWKLVNNEWTLVKGN